MDSSIPSMCIVTNAAGVIVSVINPITRERKDVHGNLERVLGPAGWALTGHETISWPGHGKPAKPLAPIERDRGGRIKERDPRVGQGVGGGRPRKAR
jgi:hypothetical protein